MTFSARTLGIDVVAIFVFAVLARLAHNTESDPFTFMNILDTWWPFLIGVVLAHVLAAVVKKHPEPVAPGGVLVWVVTVVVGLGIWAIRNAAMPHWSFILVATIMSGLLLLGWRAIAASVGRRSRSRATA